jgi:restriction endonuclease S subunit
MTNWPVKTLDALCNEGVVLLGRGNVISRKDITANPGPYPIYSSARENEGKFGEYGDFMFDEEMVTWSIDGGGRLFYRPKHKFSVTNVGGTLRVLKPDVIEIRYLHRALENLHSRKVFDWVFKAHPSVIRKVYDEIPIPPLDEQKRIVELIDAATERITELTACYEQARTHSNNLFISASRDVFRGNPVWPVKTLGEVCEVIAGQSPEGKFYNKEGKGAPFYQGKKDFAERVLGSPTTWTSEVTKLAQPGDILMSVRAPVGPVNLCPIEACIGRGLAAIRPSSKTDTDFIYYYLESIQSEIAGTEGAVFASINKAQIAGLRCPVPSLEEQKQIVARLDSMRAKISEMVAAFDAKLLATKNLRQSILESAFAGEL